jgi:hypothetical protein
VLSNLFRLAPYFHNKCQKTQLDHFIGYTQKAKSGNAELVSTLHHRRLRDSIWNVPSERCGDGTFYVAVKIGGDSKKMLGLGANLFDKAFRISTNIGRSHFWKFWNFWNYFCQQVSKMDLCSSITHLLVKRNGNYSPVGSLLKLTDMIIGQLKKNSTHQVLFERKRRSGSEFIILRMHLWQKIDNFFRTKSASFGNFFFSRKPNLFYNFTTTTH